MEAKIKNLPEGGLGYVITGAEPFQKLYLWVNDEMTPFQADEKGEAVIRFETPDHLRMHVEKDNRMRVE